ncbi:hypothetical protein DXT87_18665 [Arthrobacter sp. AET 35A]|nr:hypothetical protein [Arthrobacter sp. AET 35A]
MAGEKVDKRRFSLFPHDAGYVQVNWDEGLTATERDASELLESLAELSPSLCPPMLVRLNNMVSLRRSALGAFASKLNVAALALVGPTAVDRTITTFFKEVDQPPYPTRYFENAVDAERRLLDPGRHLL